MNVYWAKTALDDLDAIYQFIARVSTDYAVHSVQGIIRRSEQIGEFPLSGRKVAKFEVDQLREIVHGAYRIIYHITPTQIDIIAVVHSARDLLGTD